MKAKPLGRRQRPIDGQEFPACNTGSTSGSHCPRAETEATLTASDIKKQVAVLAHKKTCPRCDFDKTWGTALCRSCRNQLPVHMRAGLERIPEHDASMVARALRAAANYLNLHFQSIRNFGGGKKRS